MASGAIFFPLPLARGFPKKFKRMWTSKKLKVIVKNKSQSTTIFHGFIPINHRNNVKIFRVKTLKSGETTVPFEFSTF